jgi:regulator of PEP synthase PpsR (kinase-PPPase family)
MKERYAFIVSDRTGITAQTMGHMLLSQFPTIKFKTVSLPFTDTDEKAQQAVRQINSAAGKDDAPPLIFATLVDDKIREIISRSNGVFFDMIDQFIQPLEKELGIESSHAVGSSHGVVDPEKYTSRIAAVNFAVRTDDGVHLSSYNQAAVVIIGVSRTGKTPTSLYLSLHFGIYVANFPLTPGDLDAGRLPSPIEKYRDKLFGLSIDPERLAQIRQERFPKGRYAQLKQCKYEVSQAEAMFRQENIPYVNTTSKSIEEIATTIIHRADLKRDLI